MAQVIINNGDTGLAVRNALNNMLAELYSSVITATKIKNQAANFIFQVPANTFVHDIFIAAVGDSTPTVRVGKTPNGNEWSGEDLTPDAEGDQLSPEKYFAPQTPIYFTIIGGVVNIRINQETNFY